MLCLLTVQHYQQQLSLCSSSAQVHDSVVVTRLLAYWQQVVGWVQLQWRSFVEKLPVHHQTRAEAAAAWLEIGWDRVQHLGRPGTLCRTVNGVALYHGGIRVA